MKSGCYLNTHYYSSSVALRTPNSVHTFTVSHMVETATCNTQWNLEFLVCGSCHNERVLSTLLYSENVTNQNREQLTNHSEKKKN